MPAEPRELPIGSGAFVAARRLRRESSGRHSRHFDDSSPVGIAGEALAAIIRDAIGQQRSTFLLKAIAENAVRCHARGTEFAYGAEGSAPDRTRGAGPEARRTGEL